MFSQGRLEVPSSENALTKRFAVEAAERQQVAIEEQCQKSKLDIPSYKLLELIGKGAYGRVYKSQNTSTNRIVAVKIIDTETMDIEGKGDGLGLKDTIKEIEILGQLKRSNTVNINLLIEAFGVLSSLWIVSEYCPGGSLTTLRRAVPMNRLAEQYIRAIARELAIALKSVHEADIVHRDVKCSNVMIHENGSLQLIDFGVAGLLPTNKEGDKRTTIIGTPHWMPPEMQKDVKEVDHSSEVDVWAYGITLFECAMGAPPNRQKVGRQLKQAIRNSPPKLSPEEFPEDLCDLVSFACEIDPKKRPTMNEICEHNYVKDTAETHPTSMLQDLVVDFYNWQNKGNQRTSILDPNAAEALKFRDDDDGGEWTFSTTAKFEKRMSGVPEGFDPSFRFPGSGDGEEPYDEETAKRSTSTGRSEATEDSRAARGKQLMQGIFDNNFPTYKYNYGKSDLPFRTGDGSSSFHHKELSVNSNNGQPTISLNNPPKQAKRDTQNWTFADNQPPPLADSMPDDQSISFQFPPPSEFSPARPPLKHAATMPVGPVARPITLDLDALMGPGSYSTGPDTSEGFETNFSGSVQSFPSYNQDAFSEEPPDAFEADMAVGRTMRPSMYEAAQLDLDAGFGEFDHPDPASAPFGLSAHGFPSFSTGPGSEPLASHASTRLPSPEPIPFNDMSLPSSPPPASPPQIAQLQNLPPMNGMNGMNAMNGMNGNGMNGMNGLFSEVHIDQYSNAFSFPAAPLPESTAPSASFETLSREHNRQCNQFLNSIEKYGQLMDQYLSSDDDDEAYESEKDDDEDRNDAEDEDEGYGAGSVDSGMGESDGEIEESE